MKYRLLILFVVLLTGCGYFGQKDPRLQNPLNLNTLQDPSRLPDADPAPVPPVASAAPQLKSDLVLVLSSDPMSHMAMAIGLSGAAASDVTEICAQNSRGEQFCFNANPGDGSFSGIIDNADVGDLILMWGNGPTYAPGGPGINAIQKRVRGRAAREQPKYPADPYGS